MMSLTEKIAISIGRNAKLTLNINEDNENVIIYGAIGLLQIFWSILWTILIGMVFQVVFEALLFSVVVSALKKYSGGAHASSPGRCVFIGVIISTIFGLIIKLLLTTDNIIILVILGLTCIFIALFIVIKLAPVDSANKPITNIKMRKRLKHNSEMLILFYAFIMLIILLLFTTSSNIYLLIAFKCIFLGTLWQSVTLTKYGIKILNKVDFFMNFKIIKGGN
jgi:accessory gene regulator B